MANSSGSRLFALVGLAAAAVFAAACPERPDREPWLPAPAFAITSIFPASGPVTGSTQLQIHGHGFDPGSIVHIDSTATPAVVRSSNVIDVTMPVHAAGFVDVAVTNSTGATVTRPRAFNYVRIDPPVVLDITPPTGAIEGHNAVTITGTGFDLSTVVTIGGATAHSAPYPVRTSASIQVFAPPHATGSVDVIVTNLSGQTHRVAGGYTYAPTEAFDLNGAWRGEIVPHGFPGDHGAPMTMTIQSNAVISVTCGALTHTFSPPVVVAHGRFSRSASAGSIAGQAMSPIEASGTLAIPGCSSPLGWTAFK